jgi:L-ascorbate metabolism protein UlaG (beta-lactamase superfamily)
MKRVNDVLAVSALCLVAGVALAQPKPAAAGGKTEVTWWGHAAFVIKTPGGATIAIDPWLKNPKAPANAPWPETVDAILVTHGHGDHVGDTVELAKKTGAQVISSFELVALLGVEKGNGGNLGGTVRVKDASMTRASRWFRRCTPVATGRIPRRCNTVGPRWAS